MFFRGWQLVVFDAQIYGSNILLFFFSTLTHEASSEQYFFFATLSKIEFGDKFKV